MEAASAPDLMLLRELLAPPCLHPESPPGPPARKEPRTLRYLTASRRSLWPACQDSVTTLHCLQETEEGLAQPLTTDTQALRPCWELMALGNSSPLTMARNSKNLQTPISQKCCSPECPGTPPAPTRRRPRKQPNPHQGSEKEDPGFEGVTLKFQIQPDSSLQIIPTYSRPTRTGCRSPKPTSCPPSSLASGSSSSHSQGPPVSPPKAPQPSPGGSEALGARCCASCRTQRTPLWRDAEDGTPLCNACGIRYKKYGTRCSSCWLVPRKNVQPKKLCGRCGVSLEPHQGPTQEM